MLHIPGPPMPQGHACPDLRAMGDTTRGSPIPLLAGIKAHDLREGNAHLRHIQGLIRALQHVTISVLSRACLFPPSEAARLFSRLRPDPM
jgi:hypothetical protein